MNEKQRARINFMKERVVNKIPEMDLENARIMTESFRETGGEPLAIQKAKSFRRQCQEKTIKIDVYKRQILHSFIVILHNCSY